MTMESPYEGDHADIEENGGAEWTEEGTPHAGHEVQTSLHGLVDELDKLKETLGYNNQLQAIEQHLHSLQTENEELRSYAEEAIKEAERLATMNEELQGRVRQQELDEQMGAVLVETQKLKDVADEFEKDLVFKKLAEAEEHLEDIESLQFRVKELEEENAALTQNLNEYRESTEQLQRLRMMESTASGSLAPVAENGEAHLGLTVAAGVAGGAAAAQQSLTAAGGKPPSTTSSSPRSPAAASASSGGATSKIASYAAAAAVGAAGTANHRRSDSRTDPSHLAEQLAAAAGGADTGVVASAAKCLRDYAAIEAALTHERRESDRLKHEVDELRDTMFSKSFKPPSAWAEREVKYKMEKKSWEEKHKELVAHLKELEQENAEYRAASKAHEFEERIHELEAQLLQTEREKDAARAQLHELQINMRSMSDAPDTRFSPYRSSGVRGEVEGDGVHNVVAELEKQRIGIEAPLVLAEASRASMDQELNDSAASSGRIPKSDKLRALAKDRANADAAWEEHNKKSDVGSLRRSKAELETKVAMLEQQIGKMQWAIEHADQEQAVIEEQLDTAIQTGDVNNLSSLREKLKAGLASPGRVFRRKGMSPNKMAMSKQLHETTDALRSSEAEKNALRRQLAKLSRKYKAMAGAGVAVGAATGVAALSSAQPAIAPAASASGDSGTTSALAPYLSTSPDSARSSAASAPVANTGASSSGEAAASAGDATLAATGEAVDAAVSAAASPAMELPILDEFDTDELEEFLVPGIDDSEMEVLALREENELLMDQLVTAKVQLAETEGEFLRSKRDLLRAQERQQQLAERLERLRLSQQAAAQAYVAPLGAGPPAMAAELSSPPVSLTSKGGSTCGEEGGHGGLSQEVSASSVGGAVEGLVASAAPSGPAHEKHQKRTKSWMGSLRL